MAITIGETIPTSPAFLHLPPKVGDACSYMPVQVDISKLSKPLLIVVVPGAFTPTCSEHHIPPYLTTTSIEALQKAGIKQVLVLSVDSPFVTRAWGDDLIADKAVEVKKYVQDGYIQFVSDAGAEWLQSIGLVGEPEDKFVKNGLRGLRSAIIVNGEGKVEYVGVDEKRGSVDKSGIDGVLAALTP